MRDPRFLDDEPRARKSTLAMVLAVSMHVLLFGLLFFGLRWNSERPAPAMAELWSQIPNVQPEQRAAPTPAPTPAPKPEPRPEPVKPVPPKPEPKVEPPKPQPKAEVKPIPKPDIALEAEKERKAKEKADLEKAEKAKQEKAREEKAKADKAKEEKAKVEADRKKEEERKKAEEKKANDAIEAQRKQNLARLDSASPAVSSAPIKGPTTMGDPRAKADYVDKIRAKVRGNIVLPDNIPGNPEAVFQVQQLPSGQVITVKMMHSSGVKTYDDAVERAIWKSSPLPLPESKEVFERTLNLKFRPLD